MKAGRGSLLCVILSAGAGTRMKSDTPKVLHPILGRPMLCHTVDTAVSLKPSKTVLVTGKDNRAIKDALRAYRKLSFAVQRRLDGTAGALLSSGMLDAAFKGTLLVMNADNPLIRSDTVERFLGLHHKNKNHLSFISFRADKPGAYGRVIRNASGAPVKIVELTDLTPETESLNEVNSGVYAMQAEVFSLVPKIRKNKKKGELYLTDIVEIAASKGLKVAAYPLGDEKEFAGINTKSELLKASKTLRERIVRDWAEKGVVFMDSGGVFIEPGVNIGLGTVIYPGVFLHGKSKIGAGCTLYPNVRIIDGVIKDGSIIKDSTVIEGSTVGPKAEIGPFAHIRPGSRIGSAKIGNFVETKKTTVGDGSKAMHLSYLGDSTIGKRVNIGAGTITCNYDGVKKHKTRIKDGVFVGSDSQLIAPVTLGKDSYVGAGSTITGNVPSGALATSRVKQKNIAGWARRRKK